MFKCIERALFVNDVEGELQTCKWLWNMIILATNRGRQPLGAGVCGEGAGWFSVVSEVQERHHACQAFV